MEALDFDERFEPLWDALEEEMGRRAARGGSTASLDDDVAEMCATLKLPGDLAAGWRTLPALGDPAKMYAEAEAAERADTS